MKPICNHFAFSSGWVTNVINAKSLFGFYTVLPQGQPLCYQTINLPLSVVMHHISIDFQGELHSVWVSERQNIYNGVYSE